MTHQPHNPGSNDPIFAAAQQAARLGQETGSRAMTWISVISVGIGAAMAVGTFVKSIVREHQHAQEKHNDRTIQLLESINRKLGGKDHDKGFARQS